MLVKYLEDKKSIFTRPKLVLHANQYESEMMFGGQGRDPDVGKCKYLENVRARSSVPIDHQQGMAYVEWTRDRLRHVTYMLERSKSRPNYV